MLLPTLIQLNKPQLRKCISVQYFASRWDLEDKTGVIYYDGWPNLLTECVTNKI